MPDTFLIRKCLAMCEDRLRMSLTRMDAFATAHSTALLWVPGLLYKFVLDILYIWSASPVYARGGLVYHPNAIKYFIGTAMYFVLFAALPKREGDAVGILMHVQLAYTVAPMLSFYALADGSNRYIGMVFLCILLETVIIRRREKRKVTIHITGVKNYVTVGLGVLTPFCIVIPILSNGFAGLKIFNFDYVYTLRAEATYPPGFSYIFGWFTNVVIPFAMLYALEKKRWYLAVACIMLEVLFYMEVGNKYILFLLVPVLLVYFAVKTGHMLKLMYAGLCAMFAAVTLATALDMFAANAFGEKLGSIIAVRAIFFPAMIKFDFYGCFSQLPKICFSDGKIGRMLSLTYPYGAPSGYVINSYQGFEWLGSNANTGYLGEAYGQAGFLGMLLMSAIFALILRALKAYDSRENHAMVVSLFCVFIIILNDNAMLTTLLTSGMLLAFVLMFIYFDNLGEVQNAV